MEVTITAVLKMVQGLRERAVLAEMLLEESRKEIMELITERNELRDYRDVRFDSSEILELITERNFLRVERDSLLKQVAKVETVA